jgi:branched-subunit amino acid aminotransferase/4-amino-4-deoxychorismate lyase
MAAGPGDRVVRLQLRDGQAEISTRAVNAEQSVAVVVSLEVHVSYPFKTTERAVFGRALAGARRLGADDALLLTAAGDVAEGTAWSLFWWEGTTLCTPAISLGILPGIGRRRVMELREVREVQLGIEALNDRSLFLVNAVRGIATIGMLQGRVVPSDRRTAELSSDFWPD